jgi:hypothetical protein
MTSDLACHEGNRTLSRNCRHDSGEICLSAVRLMVVDAEDGSNASRDGFIKALRFDVMVSSIADRDTRRKSRRKVSHRGIWKEE